MMATPAPPIDIGSALHQEAVALRVGEAYIGALLTHDFDAIEALFTADVRFRALTPGAVRLAETASGARGWIERWFGETDRNELLGTRIEMVSDRLHLAYRVRLVEDGTWHIVEQQLFCSLGDAHLTDISLVCSGFRPIEVPSGRSPGHRPASRRRTVRCHRQELCDLDARHPGGRPAAGTGPGARDRGRRPHGGGRSPRVGATHRQ